jgi:hypothetical protein
MVAVIDYAVLFDFWLLGIKDENPQLGQPTEENNSN